MSVSPQLADRPVFVLGCTFRSGTTFVQRLLISTGQVFVWGENVGIVEELERIVRKLDSWSGISAGQREDFAQTGTDSWIANLNPPGKDPALRAVRAFFDAYYGAPSAQRGVPRWGFKEVRDTGRAARFLLEVCPDARVVLLVRHPRAVLASMATSAWYAHAGSAQGIAQAWIDNVRAFLDLRDPRAGLFRLEDFGTQPEPTLARLAALVEIDRLAFDVGVLSSVVRGSTREPQLGPEERAALADPQLRPLVAALGYDAV